MTEAEGNCCKLPWKATEEDEEETQEVTESLAAAEETSMEAAVGAVLSGLDCIFYIKRRTNKRY